MYVTNVDVQLGNTLCMYINTFECISPVQIGTVSHVGPA